MGAGGEFVCMGGGWLCNFKVGETWPCLHADGRDSIENKTGGGRTSMTGRATGFGCFINILFTFLKPWKEKSDSC